jgi:aminopeptidase N
VLTCPPSSTAKLLQCVSTSARSLSLSLSLMSDGLVPLLRSHAGLYQSNEMMLTQCEAEGAHSIHV